MATGPGVLCGAREVMVSVEGRPGRRILRGGGASSHSEGTAGGASFRARSVEITYSQAQRSTVPGGGASIGVGALSS